MMFGKSKRWWSECIRILAVGMFCVGAYCMLAHYVALRVKRDWGADFEKLSRKAFLGTSENIESVLRQHQHRDISNDTRIIEAKKLFRVMPWASWPRIIAVTDVKGFYAFAHSAYIVMSEPLFRKCDTEALAGLLAHEMAHRYTLGSVYHTSIDWLASQYVGVPAVQKTLEIVKDGHMQYRWQHSLIVFFLDESFFNSDIDARIEELKKLNRSSP